MQYLHHQLQLAHNNVPINSITHSRATLRAVIVDESVLDGKTASEALRNLGFDVCVFNDSDSAAELIGAAFDRGQQIDLVVSELSFANVPGAIFLAQCRYLYPDISIIVYSSQFLRPCDRIAMRWNSNRFVDKAAGLDGLQQAVEQVCFAH